VRVRVASVVVVLGGLVLLAPACGGSGAPKRAASAEEVAARSSHCTGAVRASWQQVANRIHAPVFCPSWLPDPFTGKLHDGRWNTIYSVARDRSYLMGFIWLEAGSGELHVNIRGYPGRTKVPTCTDTEITGGKTTRSKVPCFDDRQGTKRIGGRTVTIYTRNRDADLWHVLYAWHYRGSLYTVSQHVTAPLTYAKVVQSLNRITRGLDVIQPVKPAR
jgi:hypothetical protein